MSRLRVAVVGCGNIAVGHHLPALRELHDRYEVVAVADPTPERRELGRQAAGLPEAASEKPLAAVPADGEEMVTAAEKADVTLAVMHDYLFLPEIAAAHRVVAAGELGDVRAVTVNHLGVTDSPGAAAYRPDWRHDPRAAGGGVLIDMLHAVYPGQALAEHLLGRPAERVSASAGGTAYASATLGRFGVSAREGTPA